MMAKVVAESVNPTAKILARSLSFMLKELTLCPPYLVPRVGTLYLPPYCLTSRTARARAFEEHSFSARGEESVLG
jgi:hypothetical protein